MTNEELNTALYNRLLDEQCLALLKSPCPLADIFTEFEKIETDHMDDINQSIENLADYVIRQEKKKEER